MDYLILKKSCSVALWLYYSLSSSERGDGMIKQRTRWYPCLLLTYDLRCATFTLKYNADCFFPLLPLLCVWSSSVYSEDRWHLSTFLWKYFGKYNKSGFIFLTRKVICNTKLLCCSVLLLAPVDLQGENPVSRSSKWMVLKQHAAYENKKLNKNDLNKS